MLNAYPDSIGGTLDDEHAAQCKAGFGIGIEILEQRQSTRLRRVGAREAVRRMTDAVTAFVDGAEASDDLTLLCLKIRKS